VRGGRRSGAWVQLQALTVPHVSDRRPRPGRLVERHGRLPLKHVLVGDRHGRDTGGAAALRHWR